LAPVLPDTWVGHWDGLRRIYVQNHLSSVMPMRTRTRLQNFQDDLSGWLEISRLPRAMTVTCNLIGVVCTLPQRGLDIAPRFGIGSLSRHHSLQLFAPKIIRAA
jgi:hypothetical protein